MAASRRFLFTCSFIRIHGIALANASFSFSQSLHKKPSIFNSLSLLLSKTSPSPKLQLFQRYNFCSSSSSSSSSSTVDNLTDGEETEPTTTNTVPCSSSHPWPEWVSFLNFLKSKGYFGDDDDDDVVDDVIDNTNQKNLNKLETACLDFANRRFDIIKLLSREDIQTVVGCGCPNLFRKAVNAGKRLRVFVKLDEGDVCCACNLRGSCDKAYVILQKSDSTARTVDIVRILFFYALDPLVLSGEKPHGREQVEASVRKLLLQLIELGEKSPDPALPEPIMRPANRKEQSEKVIPSQRTEMKRGDWICSKCDCMNFARNVTCIDCGEEGPKKVSTDVEMKRGDWICPKCNFMNFSRNVRCLQCREEGPKKIGVEEVEMKKGDWNCPQCQFMNFARNTKCLRCRESRPKRQLNPGEWECPSCDFLNYRRNMVCLKCNCERPKDEVAEYEDQIWRRP